jgi:hypothetical protein
VWFCLAEEEEFGNWFGAPWAAHETLARLLSLIAEVSTEGSAVCDILTVEIETRLEPGCGYRSVSHIHEIMFNVSLLNISNPWK